MERIEDACFEAKESHESRYTVTTQVILCPGKICFVKFVSCSYLSQEKMLRLNSGRERERERGRIDDPSFVGEKVFLSISSMTSFILTFFTHSFNLAVHYPVCVCVIELAGCTFEFAVHIALSGNKVTGGERRIQFGPRTRLEMTRKTLSPHLVH